MAQCWSNQIFSNGKKTKCPLGEKIFHSNFLRNFSQCKFSCDKETHSWHDLIIHFYESNRSMEMFRCREEFFDLRMIAVYLQLKYSNIIIISSIRIEWPPLIRITLGQHNSDSYNRMITLTDGFVYCLIISAIFEC